MGAAVKRKTSLTLNVSALDAAHEVGINASAVAEDALIRAVTQEQRRQWLNENADVFSTQAAWHEQNGHPLEDILAGPGSTSWKS